jgi:cyclopropane fatty-acyl-phospholipid synthase-like methyltransferase
VTHGPIDSSAKPDGGWDAYWEELTDRQRLFREQAGEYVRNLAATGLLHARARVLDFGCGFGYVADGVASLVGELYLWDASANMRRHAATTVAGHANVHFLDFSGPDDPEAPPFDLILVNSVVQYMNPDEFSTWLARWQSMLAPSGRIVVSDLIPPQHRSLSELWDLLRFSARRGFLLEAVWQAIGELGQYGRMRRANPLTRLGGKELTRRGQEAGLAVTFLPRNLTHFPKRITAAFSRRAA